MEHSAFQSDLSPTRILVVDPSDRARALYEEAFSDLGCETAFARDGFEALTLIDAFEPTLVFTNTLLARLDGYKLAGIITRNRRFRDRTPVILVSHDADLFERAHGRLMGAREHLLHPMGVEKIREAFYRNA
jgi:twitching motility two-component system response regulator PilG